MDRLVALGMAWEDGARLRLPDRLVEHFGAESVLAGDRPALRAVRVEDLRVLAEAHGVASAGLRKAELVEAATTALADEVAVAHASPGCRPGPCTASRSCSTPCSTGTSCDSTARSGS